MYISIILNILQVILMYQSCLKCVSAIVTSQSSMLNYMHLCLVKFMNAELNVSLSY